MNYIYKFIEYVNESDILNYGLLIFAIGYLIYLHNQKEEDEEYLGVKLIGFYLLGAFTFNFGNLPIVVPVGFFVYLAFMKSKERANSTIKKKASVLGFIILCLGVLNSMVYHAVEYRYREIPIKNISVKSLRSDYDIIKKELGIDDVASVQSFDLDYNKNNEIKSLYYIIKDFNNKTFFISNSNNGYSVRVNKGNEYEDDFFMFNSMYYDLDIETLLDVVSNVKFKESENASYYTVIYRDGESYYENNDNLYIVDMGNFSTEKLDTKYPVYDSVGISHMPMIQVSDGSYESTITDTYLTRYNIDENSDEELDE